MVQTEREIAHYVAPPSVLMHIYTFTLFRKKKTEEIMRSTEHRGDNRGQSYTAEGAAALTSRCHLTRSFSPKVSLTTRVNRVGKYILVSGWGELP